MGEALGFDVVSSKAGGCRRGLCLNRWNGAGPTTDSIDHRARACYFAHGFLYDELHCAVGMHSLSVPPSMHFEGALHLVNQGLHHS